jgi:hypothetical protein
MLPCHVHAQERAGFGNPYSGKPSKTNVNLNTSSEFISMPAVLGLSTLYQALATSHVSNLMTEQGAGPATRHT